MIALARKLIACIGVIFVIALQGVGVAKAEHHVEHALSFPGVSYQEFDAVEHDHEVVAEHAEVVVDAVVEEALDRPDQTPTKHHHHTSGGDLLTSLPSVAQTPESASIGIQLLGPSPDAVPAGALIDAPHQPPRQNA